MKVCVIGLGYVGMCQAAGLAKLGFAVSGVDLDEDKVGLINNKTPPIYEDGLKELLEEVVPDHLTATTNLAAAVKKSDVLFVCVGTPSKKEGSMSIEQLRKVCEDVGKTIQKTDRWFTIVVKSTIVPGTIEEVVIPVLEKYSKKKFGEGFGVIMNPEFLREGLALKDFFSPDRIILGSSDKKSINSIKEVYRSFKCPILTASFKEAEMIKYASNAFLATKISFINEMGNICKKLGIDTNTVSKGISMDHRISPHFLRSGIGFGGSCFPKDVNAIIYKATEQGYNARLLRSVLDVNREQPLKMMELLDKYGPLKGKKVGVLGLTFKEGTDDIRESPALNTIKELLMEEATLCIYDPKAMRQVKKIFPHLKYMKNADAVVKESEIILILTEWPQFKDVDYKNKIVIDGKNVFDRKRPKRYEGICW